MTRSPAKSNDESMNDITMRSDTSIDENNAIITGTPIVPNQTPYAYVPSSSIATPLKNSTYGTPVLGITTPSGSYVYNPFYKEFIKGLNSFTVSPGIFAPTAASSFHYQNQDQDGLSNRMDGDYIRSKHPEFCWSPEIAGDLFPEDIDENPVSQFKLQKTLSSQQYSDFVQSQIDSFFQSQVVVPSPMTTSSSESPPPVNCQPVVSFAPLINSPIGSSVLKVTKPKSDDHTPKGRNAKSKTAVLMADVQLQTVISIPPEFDLLSLLQSKGSHIPNNQNQEPFTTLETKNSEPDSVRCDECFVERSDAYPHRGLFMCMSCREKTDLHAYSRRSLFVETLDAIADNSADFSTSTENLNLSNNSQRMKQRDTLTDSTTLSNLSMRTSSSRIPYKLATQESVSPPVEDISLPVAESSVIDVSLSKECESYGSPVLDRKSPSFQRNRAFLPSPDISPIASLSNSIENENCESDFDEPIDQSMNPSTNSFFVKNQSIECLEEISDY